MKNISHHLAALSLTAWVGSLWAIGYLAVPVLFHAQPDKQLAGMLAGQMFSSAGYLGLACGLYLLWYHFDRKCESAVCRKLLVVIAAMLAITLVIQLGLQPAMADLKAQALPLDITQSNFYGRFKMLHGISSILYLIESLLGG
ncbi:MAG: DUF4149 domain-containing protein, partial [Gallionella sp.]|nr:DUF4149 domain-containing protein [Gallionella sp.]